MAHIQTGSFTSTGVDVILNLPSSYDYIKIYNVTQAAATGGAAFKIDYVLGMPNKAGIALFSGAASAVTAGVSATNSFVFVDSSLVVPGVLNNGSTGISAISTGTPPRVTVGSTAGMRSGSIVRLYNPTGATQLGGLDFTITVIDSTHFDLAYMATLGGAGTGGSFRAVTDQQFYPRARFITAITQAAQAVVTLSVTHGYTVGQKVAFLVPAVYGMVQMSGLTGTVTAVNLTTNTLTVDIDSSAFSAFAFPVTGTPAFTPAQIVPAGENMAFAQAQNVPFLDDAVNNVAITGVKLLAGATGPAGQNNDVIFWEIGKNYLQ